MRQALLAWIMTVAGCVTDSEPYPVAAVANLEPLGSEITGPIEVIGPPSAASQRTLTAQHVRLPDGEPRRVRIFELDVCDSSAAPAIAYADLQEIRRVGDQTHFFALDLTVEGRRVDVDTRTVMAYVSTDPADPQGYVIGKIAVVQELDHDDGTPGRWLACGAFAVTGAAR